MGAGLSYYVTKSSSNVTDSWHNNDFYTDHISFYEVTGMIWTALTKIGQWCSAVSYPTWGTCLVTPDERLCVVMTTIDLDSWGGEPEYEGRVNAVQLGLCWMTVASSSRDIRPSLFATGVCLLKNAQTAMLTQICAHSHTPTQSLPTYTGAPVWYRATVEVMTAGEISKGVSVSEKRKVRKLLMHTHTHLCRHTVRYMPLQQTY